MMFCNTPYQSALIGFLGGLIIGFSAVITQQYTLSFVGGISFVIISELVVHEIRQDSQYINAKKRLKQSLSK